MIFFYNWHFLNTKISNIICKRCETAFIYIETLLQIGNSNHYLFPKPNTKFPKMQYPI